MLERGRGICLLLLAASCSGPEHDPAPPASVTFDTAALDEAVNQRLKEFRNEMGSRYASFEKATQLSNRINTLRSDLRDLGNRVENGENTRFDGITTELEELDRRIREAGRREEEERAPLRSRLLAVEQTLTEMGDKTRELEAELNVAYAELHGLREEMLGILGELQVYRKANQEALQLRLDALEKEREILERAKVDG